MPQERLMNESQVVRSTIDHNLRSSSTSPIRRSNPSAPKKPKQPWQSPCLADSVTTERRNITVKKRRKLRSIEPPKSPSKPEPDSVKAKPAQTRERFAEILTKVSWDWTDGDSYSLNHTLLNSGSGTQIRRSISNTRAYVFSGDGAMEENDGAIVKQIKSSLDPGQKRPWEKSNTATGDQSTIKAEQIGSAQGTCLRSPEAILSRYHGSSSQYYPPNATQPLRDPVTPPLSSSTISDWVTKPTKPTYTVEDDKLMLSFENIVEGALYEITIDIELIFTEYDGWQRLNIPQAAPFCNIANDAYPGSFFFRMEPITEHMAKRHFDTTCLMEPLLNNTSIEGLYDLSQPLFLALKQEIDAYLVPLFDMMSTTYISLDHSENQARNGFRVRCAIHLRPVLPPRETISSKYVSFRFVLCDSTISQTVRTLDSGECMVEIFEEPPLPDVASHDDVSVTITRPLDDLDKEMVLCFTSIHDGQPPFTLRVPTIHPDLGKSLTETVIVCQPPEPLLIDYQLPVIANPWKCSNVQGLDSLLFRFDRSEEARALAKGFVRDDILLKVTELPVARFAELQTFGLGTIERGVRGNLRSPFGTVRRAAIWIGRLMGGGVQCHMQMELLTDDDTCLLRIDLKGWVLAHAIVDSKLSSESNGEWRQADDHILLLRPQMGPGQSVWVEVCFNHNSRTRAGAAKYVDDDKGKKNDEASDIQSRPKYHPPVILGKYIVNASLQCGFKHSRVTVWTSFHPPKLTDFLRGRDSSVRLPHLKPGYRLKITDLSQKLTDVDRMKIDRMKTAILDKFSKEKSTVSLDSTSPLPPIASSARKLPPGARVRFADEKPTANESGTANGASEEEMLQDVAIFPEDFGAGEEEGAHESLTEDEDILGDRSGWTTTLVILLLAVVCAYLIDPDTTLLTDRCNDLPAAFEHDVLLLRGLADTKSVNITHSLRSFTGSVPWGEVTTAIAGFLSVGHGGGKTVNETGVSEATAELLDRLRQPNRGVDGTIRGTRVVNGSDAMGEDQTPTRTIDSVEADSNALAPQILAKFGSWRDWLDQILGWKPVEEHQRSHS